MASSTVADQRSVFAAFDPDLFVDSGLWTRIRTILDLNRGGNYGLSGPRGAGKSWLIQRAVTHANEHHGLGVWFPSPSEYDVKSFLSSLSEVVAQRYIEQYLAQTGAGTETGKLRRRQQSLWILIGSYLLGVVVFVIGTFHGSPILRSERLSSIFNPVTIVGFVIILAGAVVSLVLRRTARKQSTADTLYDRAVEVRTQARYSAASKEVGELSAGAAKYGLTAGLKRSKETALAERPTTVSSLVHGLREFTEQLSGYFSGPVTIGIDELDKMDDPGQVAALLRDVKGVFDVKGVHYFVSISDEAGRILELGSIRGRNEFNSSFYQVFHIEPATTSFYLKMLAARNASLPDGFASIDVASCGVPRECIRLIDVLENQRATTESASVTVVRLEVESFNQETQNTVASTKGEDEGLLAVDETSEALLKAIAAVADIRGILSDFWHPSIPGELADEPFLLSWRRLVVRAAALASVAEIRTDQLREVARVAQASPSLARRMLERLVRNAERDRSLLEKTVRESGKRNRQTLRRTGRSRSRRVRRGRLCRAG